MGRTPKVNNSGGRDHWGKIQSILVAGGGFTGGTVVGATAEQPCRTQRRAVGGHRPQVWSHRFNMGLEKAHPMLFGTGGLTLSR
jgi:hypothetical protein